MRTTIELSDEAYRTLKARAALTGTTMRELVQQLVEQGLRQGQTGDSAESDRREARPVIIGVRGQPIAAISPKALRRLGEEDDERRAGSA